MSISIKSQLAPKGLQFNPSDFFISDKYATILSVISYPRFIAPGYLSTLTSMSGIKIVPSERNDTKGQSNILGEMNINFK